MRIPFPERFSASAIAMLIAALFAGEILEGTDPVFAFLTGLFIALWAIAYNVSGGIKFTSGAFIFFNGTLTVIVGLVAKVFLWEPGERNLLAPRTTMIAYCIGMGAMVFAAFLSRGLRPSKPLLKDLNSLEQMKQGAILCFGLGILFSITTTSAAALEGTGTFLSAVRQVDFFPLMAPMLATAYEIRTSNGTRSVNWIVLASVGFDFAFGVIYFSKEGMLIGPTAWFLTAVLHRYRFSKAQLIGCLLGSAFVLYYLVPYSQYVRAFTTTSKIQNFAIALRYLSNLNETRQLYLNNVEEYDLAEEAHLYDQREGFLDRAVMLAPDDAIIAYTERGNVYGLEPTFLAYAGIVPRFIWQSKPNINFGNVYGHELNLLAETDFTTGISFSPVGEAFHQARWLALLLILPINLCIAFIVCDTVVGSTRDGPWALVLILLVSHAAPEGGLEAPVYLATYQLLGVLLLYWTLMRAMPLVLNVLKPKDSGSIPGPPRLLAVSDGLVPPGVGPASS